MADLTTYSLSDFIPFTAEVYFRLFVRVNQAAWPLHLAAMLAGITALWAAILDRGRLMGLMLGICWAWVGWTFLLGPYANLNWAGSYAGWGFIAEGVLLVVYGLLGQLDRPEDTGLGATGWTGIGLAIFGLGLFPLIGPLTGRAWRGVEIFGIAPDPTALATLGLLLTAARTRWLLLVAPVIWCLWSGATGWVVGAPSGLVAAGTAVVAVGVAVWKAVVRDSC